MADSIWGTGRRLDESLFRSAYEFEFFQAVRLLTLYESELSQNATVRPARDAMRFAIHPSLSFPPSPVVDVDRGVNGQPPRIIVAFLGLIGPAGVLPICYTEMAVHQEAFGNHSFAAFFDIFHHRLLSLFYRAWEKHHIVVGFEQAAMGKSKRDPITSYLLDMIGMGSFGLEDRLPFPDVALLRYAGLLAQRPRSAEGLRALLHDFLGVPITVEQFVGRWHPLESDELSMLGSELPSSQLGDGTVAGNMVWSRQASVRIVLGPLPREQFFQFLPNGEAFYRAAGLVRWFLGPTTDFEMQPVLQSGEVPDWCRLGETRIAGPRLGWCSWLTEEPFRFPASEAIFRERECVQPGGLKMPKSSEAIP
jgi:type VI secretion system protein ImpH